VSHSNAQAGAGTVPAALTIAGSDSGGGAGIQADLRTFLDFGVHGTAALTAVTAQNPQGVTGVGEITVDLVNRQIAAVLAAFNIRAIKTGMLSGEATVRCVAQQVAALSGIPLVVDPVMVATSGATLLRENAVVALCDALLPCAAVITPNIPEAEILVGRGLPRDRDRIAAASELAARFDCTAVLKGGHADGSEAAVDYVSDGHRVWALAAARIAAPTTHGTGCSFSAALAAALALGDGMAVALRKAKAYVGMALSGCVRVGPETWAMRAISPRLDLTLDTVQFTEV